MSGVTKADRDRHETIAAAFLLQVINNMSSEEVTALTWADLELPPIHVAPRQRKAWRAMRLFGTNEDLAAVRWQLRRGREDDND